MRSTHLRPFLTPTRLALGLLAGFSTLATIGLPAAQASGSGIITPTAPIPGSPAISPESARPGAVQPPKPAPTSVGTPAAVLNAPVSEPSSPPPAPAGGAAPAEQPAAPQAAPVSNARNLLALGKREIRLERDGKVYGPWPVAIGDPATPTPTGTFRVENKVVNPMYASTRSGKVNPTVGPSSPLGDRWIGFKQSGPNQFGIHGTPWPTWVDQRAAVTNGCVRMKHEHVRQLFELVEVGTPVVVTR
jgi:lipoprotein-anchoring transpeptidase ErfK/SrfK